MEIYYIMRISNPWNFFGSCRYCHCSKIFIDMYTINLNIFACFIKLKIKDTTLKIKINLEEKYNFFLSSSSVVLNTNKEVDLMLRVLY